MPTMRQSPRNSRPNSSYGQRKSDGGSHTLRRHFVAAVGEFVGTFMFLLMGFLGHSMAVSQSTQSVQGDSNATATASQQVVFISLAYGFSLLVTAWTLYRVSGGLFNPAVTLGLVVAGELPAFRGLILFPAQVLGAICSAAVVSAIIPGPISVVETTLNPLVSVAQGVFLEMFLTAQLVLTILVLAADKSKDTFLAPIGIGLALFIVEIAGVYYTGASVNPARSFGPCVAAANFQTYHWIYWIGPAMGALIAAGFYRFIKFLNMGTLEAANPGQDSADGEFDAGIEKTVSQDPETGGGAQVPASKQSPARHNSGGNSRANSRGREGQGQGYSQYPPVQSQQGNYQQYQQYPPQQMQQPQQYQGHTQSWGSGGPQDLNRRSQDVRRSGSQQRRY